MLNLDAIRNGVMEEYPYRWILFDNLIPKPQLEELNNTFPPIKIFPQREKPAQRPSIVVYDETLELVSNRTKKRTYYDVNKLSNTWQTLIQELHSPSYRKSLAELTGLNLDNNLIRITLSRVDKIVNHPHPDGSKISLTHVFYLSDEDWNIEWGGCLQILLNEQLESVFREIPPRNGNSVILIRSDNSWHNVSPILPHVSQHRMGIGVRFFNPTFL